MIPLRYSEFEDTQALADIQLSESVMESAVSHVMFYNEESTDVDVVLLDEEGRMVEYLSFEDLEYAEVWLEEEFEADILPLDEYDLSNISSYKSDYAQICEVRDKIDALVSKVEMKIKQIRRAMGSEAQQTKDMIGTFFDLLKNKLGYRAANPTPAEIDSAIEQLKDVHRLAAMFAIWSIPTGTTMLVLLSRLAAKYNVKFLPSSFQPVFEGYDVPEHVLSKMLEDLEKVETNEEILS